MTHRSPLTGLRLLTVILILSITAASVPVAEASPLTQDEPETVSIPGSYQSKAGCPGDWQPDCEASFLTYDPEDDLWQGEWAIPAGEWEYKVAINGAWTENYGLNAVPSGPNIPLALTEDQTVKFYYDHKTHWVTENATGDIFVAAGSFQSEIGCTNDNDPTCLRTWLQDPEASGTYSTITRDIPPGTYTVTVALDESFSETYGLDGTLLGEPYEFTVEKDGSEVYFGYDPSSHRLTISTEGAPRGNLLKAQAYWVTSDTIVWDITRREGTTYRLHYDPNGALKLGVGDLTGGEYLTLTASSDALSNDIRLRFPHLTGLTSLVIDPADLQQVPAILQGQVAVSAWDADGKLIDATSLQIPGVLDDLYIYDGPLGISFDAGGVTLRVWAPTARSVALLTFNNPGEDQPSGTVPMTRDPQTGVWSVSGPAEWTGSYYLYEVQVYVPSTGKIETNRVTDPYSISLSMNSQKSQIIDLSASNLKPAGWDQIEKPPLNAPEDIVIYELHVRDFSAYDETVPENYRGTFKAFTQTNSDGMMHLKELADAGLTHIHLLPVFDIASVNENPAEREEPNPFILITYPGDSDQQATLIVSMNEKDAFNWGYDPYHYTTPEGSYATDPNGSKRILEFREMVQALNSIGLRVVMDVVYNHTSESGQNARSVLDKVVPGYYYRLDANGAVTTSTCCQNTATEHRMMEKLMIDSMVTWAVQYEVDGFRMDLMGHHMLSNVTAIRAALDSLTLEKDGVDGKAIYLYGEGWDFGEVAGNARGKNATQLNIGGTGIGVFNDRLRDAVRGGSPFDDPRTQGFITGLFLQPSTFVQGGTTDQEGRLLRYSDWIRLGMAGNLENYQLVDALGKLVPGSDIDYNGAPAGYTQDPQENIIYISAHDNQTLFDAIQVKASGDATIDARVRMNNLGNAIVMFSQGVPFFHAGDDILRSKSLDKNSYNSGDWFNRLDFTYQTNNWAVGLPPGDSQGQWEIDRPLLADEDLQVDAEQIQFAHDVFLDLLRIRKSSPLFRLQTAQDIIDRVSFLNTGTDQTQGLIVMVLSDLQDEDLDPQAEMIVVLLNANPNPVTFSDASLQGIRFALHPVQAEGADEVVKTSEVDTGSGSFTIPGRTAAVFVAEKMPVSQNQILTVAAAVVGGLAVIGFGLLAWVRGKKKR